MQRQTDFFMDRGASRRADSDRPGDRSRLYEVAGSAHAYSRTSRRAPARTATCSVTWHRSTRRSCSGCIPTTASTPEP
jgi:hypothetical protein